jgi:hypothetical protein
MDMAYILQKDVREIYVSDSSIKGSKNVLFVYEGGDLELKWCCQNVVEKQLCPSLVRVGKCLKLEYGEPNLFQIRQIIPFQDENGKLEPCWEKIM